MVPSRKSPSIHAAYAIPPTLAAAMSPLAAALDENQSVQDAIHRNVTSLEAAAVTRDAAATTLAEAEAALVRVADESQTAHLEQVADEAQTAVDGAERLCKRLAARGTLQYADAAEVNTKVLEAQRTKDAEQAAFANTIANALDAEARAALTAFVDVLARAQALRTMGLLTWGTALLVETLIPSAVHGRPPLVHGSRVTLPSGEVVDLAEIWREHPSAVELASVYSELHGLNRRAAIHRAITPPPKPAVKYLPNAQNVANARFNADADARDAARDALPKPVKPPTLMRAPHVPDRENVAAAEFNNAADAAEQEANELTAGQRLGRRWGG